jgi:hypothetical protein
MPPRSNATDACDLARRLQQKRPASVADRRGSNGVVAAAGGPGPGSSCVSEPGSRSPARTASAGLGCSLERGDVDLDHLQHRVRHPLRLARSGSLIISPSILGTICQLRP